MSTYKLTPVEKAKRWAEEKNTPALRSAIASLEHALRDLGHITANARLRLKYARKELDERDRFEYYVAPIPPRGNPQADTPLDPPSVTS